MIITRAVEVQRVRDSSWTTDLPGPDHQAHAATMAVSRAPAPASPGRGEKEGQQGQLNIKPRQGRSKEGTSQGVGRKEGVPVGWDEQKENIKFNSWIYPRFPSQEPQAFPQEEGSSASSVDRKAAAEETKPPKSASLGS